MNETNVRHLLLLIRNSLLFSLTLVNLALKLVAAAAHQDGPRGILCCSALMKCTSKEIHLHSLDIGEPLLSCC